MTAAPGRGKRSRASVVALQLAIAASLAGCELILGDLPANPALEADGASAQPDADVKDAALDREAGGEPSDAGELERDANGDAAANELDAAELAPADAQGAAPDADAGQPDPSSPPDSGSMGDADAGRSDEPDPGACGGAGEKRFFADRDGDGYGDPSATQLGCSAPSGWVERAGDCHDGHRDVHEEQTMFFGQGYQVPNGTARSFDYDCSGAEVPAPNQRIAPEDCSGLLQTLCGGEGGYLPTEARAGQMGANPYCGSNVTASCGLLCEYVTGTSPQPFVCH